jgi:hypothetical protein
METLIFSSRIRRSRSCREGNELAFLADERAVVDAELHLEGRRVNLREGQGVLLLAGGKGVADVDILEAGEANDVAGDGGLDLALAQAGELEDLGDLGPDLFAALGVAHDEDRIADLDDAAEDLADRDAADVVAPVDVGDEHVERLLGLGERGRDVVDDGLEEGRHVLLRLAEVIHHVAVAAGAVDDGRVELLLGGVELHEQLEDLVIHFRRLGVVAVDLVDDDHDLQPVGESLAEHETGLRLRAVIGVDDEEHAVDHAEGALDLAAEVGVAGGVENVDDLVLPVDGGVLGLDRDALFAFEIHGVHGAFLHLLVGAVDPALLEELVDEGGFAVVDVGDDGDVADVLVHVRADRYKVRNRVTLRAAPGLGKQNLGPCSRRQSASLNSW